MQQFEREFKRLNAEQKRAVVSTEGPLLVLAGPGTGKTQLLSMRAGQILKSTDVSPENLLCITFTDAAAQEMRDRLHRLIGRDSGRINVFTFHSFGADIISRYPEYFDARQRGLRQLDDLSRYALLEELLATLPLRHPFAIQNEQGQFLALNAVEKGVKAIKQSALSVDELLLLAKANEKALDIIEPLLQDCFSVARLSMKHLDTVMEVATQLHESNRPEPLPGYLPLEQTLGLSLLQAIEACHAIGKTGPVGKWRDRMLRRKGGKHVLYARLKQREFTSLITLYERYQQLLDERGLFDYEDMILWVLDALKSQDDLRLTLAEQYLYIMVDEYQDTNGAQNQLIHELSGISHGVEQPNVMAVGDDDQAIMRFQGAEMSNMLDFARAYGLSGASIISLTDNYRSHKSIIDASRSIITQTSDRLEVSLQEFKVSKLLVAKASIQQPVLKRYDFESEAEEYYWLASEIKRLLSKGHPAEQISIIAPRHAILMELAPYLQAKGIATSYERRDNVLEQPLVKQLIAMSRLLMALYQNRLAEADSYLPEILSYPFWELPAITRAKLAFTAEAKRQRWLETMLESDNELRHIAQFLLALKDLTAAEPFERLLDSLIGTAELQATALKRSPFKAFYFSSAREKHQGGEFVRLISSLVTLRDAVRNHYGRRGTFYLKDFLEVVDLYNRSGIQLTDKNTSLNGSGSVKLLTAHGSKGREFQTVFIVHATEDVWGPTNRTNSRQIYLPDNLPIYPAGNSLSDKLRLLYVAMTRAKQQLIITAHRQSGAGRPLKPLSMLQFDGEGWWTPEHISVKEKGDITAMAESDWQQTYNLPTTSLKQELRGKLASYRLSASGLKSFLDLRYGGPEHFKLSNLYRFPEAKSFHSCFGSAVHAALEYAQLRYADSGKAPSVDEVLGQCFAHLETEQLSAADELRAKAHAAQILPPFYKAERETMTKDASIEKYFATEVEAVRLSGKLDKIEVIDNNRIRIIDYKTGRAPEPAWNVKGLSKAKQVSVYFNRQQLLFYKILVDNSLLDGKRHEVAAAELRYVEPHIETGELVKLPITTFDSAELERLQKLMAAVWTHIIALDFPDTSRYPADITGIHQFEEDLISGKL